MWTHVQYLQAEMLITRVLMARDQTPASFQKYTTKREELLEAYQEYARMTSAPS